MPTLKLTPAQERAITTIDRDLVVSAGAGAGKTFVLVQRYLHLLDQGVSPGEILAITFTKKAAGEMRERIRKECFKRGDLQLAQAVGRAPIGTIHSLCLQILREFPLASGVDPEAKVLEESGGNLLIGPLIEEVILESLKEPLSGLEDLLRRIPLERLGGLVKGILARLRGEGMEPEDLWAYEAKLPSLEQVGQEILQDLDALHNEARLKTKETLKEALTQWQSLITQVQLDDPGLGDRVYGISLLVKARGDLGPEAKRIRDEEIRGRWAQVYNEYRWAPLRQAMIRLLERAHTRIESMKEANGFLDFADLELRLLDLLRHNPQVRETLAQRVRFIMVDEFQDTSHLQQEIFSLLCAEDPKPNLFVVGDPKQSIYRFRGAEVQVFLEAQRRVGEEGRVDLDENFRSLGEVIEFCNHLFPRLMPTDRPEAGAVGYSPSLAKRVGGEGAKVEILHLPADSASQGRELEPRSIASRIHTLIKDEYPIYERQGEEWVPRPVEFGDFAILLRARTHIKAYEAALSQAQIPYVVHDGVGFYQRPEIADVICLLRALIRPEDDLSLMAVLRSPFFSIDDGVLVNLGTGIWKRLENPPDLQLVGVRQTLERWRELALRQPWESLIKRIWQESQYPLVAAGLPDGERIEANLIKLINKAAALAAGGVYTLPDFLRQLEAWFSQEERENEAPVEAQARAGVKIMTIHAAKGLEYPVVILPDLNAQPPAEKDRVLVDRARGMGVSFEKSGIGGHTLRYQQIKEEVKIRSLHETQRLFYVGVTRARDYLMLVISGKCKEEKVTPSPCMAESVLACLPELNAPQIWFGGVQVRVEGPQALPPVALAASTREEELPAKPWGWFMPVVPSKVTTSPTALLMQATCPLRQYLSGQVSLPGRYRSGGRGTGLSALERGELVHRICENLNDPEQAPELIERFLATYRLLPDQLPQASQEVGSLVDQYLSGPTFARIRQARQVFSEVPFRLGLGRVVVRGVIDKWILGQQVEIIDFKTDQVSPEDLPFWAEHYLLQLKLYARHLQESLSRPVDRVTIAFLRSGYERSWEGDQLELEDLDRQVEELVTGQREFARAPNFHPRRPDLRICQRCPYQEIFCQEG